MNTRFCPHKCPNLKPTEAEQSRQKEGHTCQKYGKRVRHMGYHPRLVRLDECEREA